MPVFGKFGLKPGAGRHIVIDGVADGFEAFCLARLVEEVGERGPVMYIVRDGQRIGDLEQVLGFVSPRSEERRVGKGCRSPWSPDYENVNNKKQTTEAEVAPERNHYTDRLT